MLSKLFSLTFWLLLSSGVKSQQAARPNVEPTKSKKVAFSPDKKLYAHPEVSPEFPGGAEEWNKYLSDNLDTRIPFINQASAGQYNVVVRCIVSYWGSVSDVTAETKHGYGMETEAIRMIKNCPRWKPAFNAGKPVNAFLRQEVRFVVPAR